MLFAMSLIIEFESPMMLFDASPFITALAANESSATRKLKLGLFNLNLYFLFYVSI